MLSKMPITTNVPTIIFFCDLFQAITPRMILISPKGKPPRQPMLSALCKNGRKIGKSYKSYTRYRYGKNDMMPVPRLAMEITKDDALTVPEIGFSFRLFIRSRDVPHLLQVIALSWFKVPHCGQNILSPISCRVYRNSILLCAVNGLINCRLVFCVIDVEIIQKFLLR